ncbi:MAG: DUF4293 domain-containing protein [Paludibacteraceae bacterium]|nr:DUF4293 domain-containing protein [Paludibacteraceae bacterium]
MIQRRQTIYLLTIVILGVILYFCSVLQFTTPATDDIQRTFMLSASNGFEEVTQELEYMELEPVRINGLWGLQVTTLLIPLLALVDIFLYRKRILQARWNIFLALLCIGYYGILMMYVWFIRHQIRVDWDICFGACVPLVCLVLTVGATRLILKDEAMVRAADRIR